MVPDEFDLSDNLDTILAVVLDQELQRYNELLEVMKDTLKNALNGLAGKCLLSEEMEEFIEQIRDDEIPKAWEGVAYPTMDDLNGYLSDLLERVDFLRKWLTEGPPKEYWVTALFEPGDFFIALLYIHAMEANLTFHELSLEVRFDSEEEGPGILVRGLYLVGAEWDEDKHVLKDASRESIYQKMPVIRLVPVHNGDDGDGDDEEEDDGTYTCPLFQNSDREGDENFIIDFDLPTDKPSSYWVLTGTAMLCQRPLET